VSKNSRNSSIQTYYKNYCKVLSKALKAEKRLNYEKQIRNLNNKMRCAWEIIYIYIYIYMQKRGEKVNNDDVQSLNINGVNINNQQHITDFF
jgi:phosphopantetheine adenylyltransferase